VGSTDRVRTKASKGTYAACMPGDGSNEDATETKERDEEDVVATEKDEKDAGIDEDFENFEKE